MIYIITKTENNMRKTFFNTKNLLLITVVACFVIDSISMNTFHFDGIV